MNELYVVSDVNNIMPVTLFSITLVVCTHRVHKGGGWGVSSRDHRLCTALLHSHRIQFA